MNKAVIKAEALDVFLSAGPVAGGMLLAVITEAATRPLGSTASFLISTLAAVVFAVSGFLAVREAYALTLIRLRAEADQVSAAQRESA